MKLQSNLWSYYCKSSAFIPIVVLLIEAVMKINNDVQSKHYSCINGHTLLKKK